MSPVLTALRAGMVNALLSQCIQYDEGDVDIQKISRLAETVFCQKPFKWQLDACAAVLTGKDVILELRLLL